jgi:hypothetical protein
MVRNTSYAVFTHSSTFTMGEFNDMPSAFAPTACERAEFDWESESGGLVTVFLHS